MKLSSSHPKVKHPDFFLIKKEKALFLSYNDKLLDWLAEHLLASMLMFDVALIVPLIIIPAPDSAKITLGVISGSWIQWWALPALQRSQVKADAKHEAKVNADHMALTHIAKQVDKLVGTKK